MLHSFHPGALWYDTDGNPIHAHGGSMLYVDGSYYWYGENKKKTDGKNGIWHWGVRCYRSEDLYNWTDCGLIIPPDTEDKNSPLHPTSMMDRPHILYEYLEQLFGAIIEKYPISSTNIRRQVLHIFEEIYKRQADLEILKNAGLLDKIDQIILRDTVNVIQKNQVLNNKYQPYFFAGASSALIKAWIEFGFTESPRDITDIFFASLSGYMSFE